MNPFIIGFIKAAQTSGLAQQGIDKVIDKVALSNDLTEDELLAIRRHLATPENIDNYSSAPYKGYASQLLSERDQSVASVPELSSIGKAIGAGTGGAGVGGLAGYGAGRLLRDSNILGSAIPYAAKRSLPTALGSSGAVVGALLRALPAYVDNLEASKAFRKLHTPGNMAHVLNNVQMDRALLAS